MNKLNAGCGFKKMKGWVNLDNQRDMKPDVLADLNKDLDFPNNYFEEILADNVLEHIDNIVRCMNEFYRIMKPGGVLTIRVPQFPTFGSVLDPTHKHFFITKSFAYFVDAKKLPGIKAWKWHQGKAKVDFESRFSPDNEETIFMTVKLEKP